MKNWLLLPFFLVGVLVGLLVSPYLGWISKPVISREPQVRPTSISADNEGITLAGSDPAKDPVVRPLHPASDPSAHTTAGRSPASTPTDSKGHDHDLAGERGDAVQAHWDKPSKVDPNVLAELQHELAEKERAAMRLLDEAGSYEVRWVARGEKVEIIGSTGTEANDVIHGQKSIGTTGDLIEVRLYRILRSEFPDLFASRDVLISLVQGRKP